MLWSVDCWWMTWVRYNLFRVWTIWQSLSPTQPEILNFKYGHSPDRPHKFPGLQGTRLTNRHQELANLHLAAKKDHMNIYLSILLFESMGVVWMLLKVSKSQKHFFLKLHCQKNEQNIWQNSALASWGRILSM